MAKEKKLQTIVDDLRAKGHQIKSYKRKDGGIVVTNIDGVSFKGKTGNNAIRLIAGEPLSTRRESQLKTIRTPKKQFGNVKRINKPVLPKEIVNQIKRINESYSKRGKTGRITQELVAKNIREQGYDLTKKDLDYIERKGKGKIFYGNLTHLVENLQLDNWKVNDNDIQVLIEKLDRIFLIDKGAKIDEADYTEVLNIYYDWRKDYETHKTMLIRAIKHMIRRYKKQL